MVICKKLQSQIIYLLGTNLDVGDELITGSKLFITTIILGRNDGNKDKDTNKTEKKAQLS
jgi:hypothetical protein